MMRISLAVVAVFLSVVGLSQTRDAGLWMDISVSRELNKRLELAVSPEIRLNENCTQWSRLFADVGVDYKLDKHFSLHAAYRGGWGNDGVYIDPRQRWQTGFSLKHKIKDVSVQWLSRAQYTLVGPLSDSDADFVTLWRNRASVKYTGLKKTDVSTSFEFFNSMHRYQQLELQNWRWIGQVSRKVSKKQSVVLGYLIQRDYTKVPNAMDYVLLVSYKVDL
jgi:hypothetical protein